ncbi:VOC family protein [Reichenbachiella sp.]|uniref:VOC family protein n=1 Tax=Reichenbachiella sp. TaxID=2184521 RepID=UPI003BB19E33
MKPRISMVALGVKDLDQSIKFYRDGLQLPMMDSPPEVAFFNLNGTWLGLSKREDMAKDAGVNAEGNGYSGFNLAHNVSSQKEVLDVLDQAIKAGAILVKKPQKADWGGFHGYFKDLDGHLWEIAHNPFVWFGPKD